MNEKDFINNREFMPTKLTIQRYQALRLVRLWRKEARANLAAARTRQTCQNVAFERGLALAKQQCAEQLRRAAG